jgi:hypothetical protein
MRSMEPTNDGSALGGRGAINKLGGDVNSSNL